MLWYQLENIPNYDSFDIFISIYVCPWVSCVTITPWQLHQSPTEKNPVVMDLLSNGFRHLHTSHVSRVAEILWEMILLYIRTIIQMILLYFTDLPTPWGKPPLWQTTDLLHEAVPTLTLSTHQVGNFVVRAKYKPLPFARHSWLPGP